MVVGSNGAHAFLGQGNDRRRVCRIYGRGARQESVLRGRIPTPVQYVFIMYAVCRRNKRNDRNTAERTKKERERERVKEKRKENKMINLKLPSVFERVYAV